MGRTHATSGALAALVVYPLLADTGILADWPTVVAYTVVAAGGAMLPDFDHPKATVARGLGPVTMGLAGVVSAVSGGHRNGTHSILGVGAFTALTWGIGQAGGVWLGVWVGFLFAVAMAALRLDLSKKVFAHYGLSLAGGVGLAYLGALGMFDPRLFPVAVAVGASAHLLGDMVTKEGVPLLWPVWRKRFKVGNVTTGSVTETLLIGPGLGVATVGLALYYAGVVDWFLRVTAI